jgi:drug/metabolite transporter (DMT)-like permease
MLNLQFPYLGQSLALLTAIVWAFAVILFKKSGETVHPIALNLFKNVLALILFLPTLWIFGETLFRPAPTGEYLLLIFSGILGIGVGDTLFFKSLNRVGAGLWAIVACLYSPFIIGLSVLYLGETLTLFQAIGAVIIISAVLLTIRSRDGEKRKRADILWGILWGVVATAATAAGIVMIKPLLERSPLLWALQIRLLGGIFSLAVLTILHPSGRKFISTLFQARNRIYTVSGSFMGAYLAMLFWLAGMKYTQASIASALHQTSTLFVLLFASLFLKERFTLRRLFTVLLAICGAFLVIFG